MGSKICISCKEEKYLACFSKSGKYKDRQKYSSYCKDCTKKRWEKYAQENRQMLRELRKDYRLRHPDKDALWFKSLPAEKLAARRERARLYNQQHREERRIYNNRYCQENREKKNSYLRWKRANDLNFKLAGALRGRINQAIRKGQSLEKAGSAVKDLGCSISDLKLHLEALFKQGMSWENYGSYWHIDHIVPLSYFDLSDREDFLKACHYTNLQPLLAYENWKKGNRYADSPSE